jgi:hypothetical protein
MNDTPGHKPSRRFVLKCAAAIAGLAAVPSGAYAQAKASKASMKYQEKPNGKQQCDNCLQFVPGKSASAKGTCKVVEGDISPKGWCIAYAAKSP